MCDNYLKELLLILENLSAWVLKEVLWTYLQIIITVINQ